MSTPGAPRLSRAFYARDSLTVAPDLLGKRLVRVLEDPARGAIRLGGLICETEAYAGPLDPASHAYHRTDRSAIMYGPPGFAYVYFIYGAHYCLNAVTDPDGIAGAVLIRALIPTENVVEMRRRRSLSSEPPSDPLRGIADGPGKLCEALGITLKEKGLDLTESDELFVEEGVEVSKDEVITSPRVGVRGDEETRLRPWRFRWRPRQ